MATIPKFEDTLPVDTAAPKFEDTVPVDDTPPKFEDTVPLAAKPSETESFVRGGIQGVAQGFVDEIAGQAEALGSKVGLRGVGGGFNEWRRETPEEDKQTWDEVYEQGRDKRRAQDNAAKEAHPNYYLGGEVTGGVAVSLIPYVGMTAKTAKGAAAIGGVSGAITGTGNSEADTAAGVAEDAAITAAFGAVLGSAVHGAIKGVTKLIGGSSADDAVKRLASEEAIDDVLNGLPNAEAKAKVTLEATDFDMGKAIQSRADKLFAELPDAEKVLPEELPPEFMNRLMGKPTGKKVAGESVEEFKHIWEQYSPEAKQDIWKGWQQGQQLLKAGKEIRKEAVKTMSGLADPFEDTDKLLWQNMAGHQLARKTDNVMGSNFYGDVVGGFTTGERHVATDAQPFLTALKPVKQQLDKHFTGSHDAFFEIMDGTKLGKKLEAGLNQEQRDVVNNMRNFYAAAVPEFNQRGMNIVPKESFIPHKMKDLSQARGELLRMADSLVSKYGNDININTVTHKLPQDVQDYLAAVNHLNEDVVDFVTLKHTKKFLETFKPVRPTEAATRFDGSAAFQRGNDIPRLLLEKDPIKLATGYIINNLKSIHYREPLTKLHDNIAALRAAGANKTADVWEIYAEQMTGRTGGHKARVDAMAEKLRDAGRKIADEWGWKKTGSTIEHLPETLSWMTAQIYPNYLGWRLDAPIRNLSQPLMVTAPEIGWKNSTRIASGAWKRAVKARAQLKAEGHSMGSFLQKKGLSVPKHKGLDAMDAIERGAQLVNAGKAMKALDAGGKTGLTLYSMTDDINRFFTYHVAEEIADDILKNGTGRYTPMLKRMPAGFRTKLLQAAQSGNIKDFRKGLTLYLTEHTQFNYTRSDLTMFGREYGRMASMFTKWPITVAGNIHNIASNERGLKAKAGALSATYFAPLATLTLLDHAIDMMEMTDDPVKKTIIGKNLAQNSPLLAVKDLAIPPILQSGKQLVEAGIAAAQGELSEAGNKFAKGVLPFIPGGYIPVAGGRVMKNFGDDE